MPEFEDLAEKLAKYVADLEFEQLPLEVVNKAKSRIMDSFGCMIAGSNARWCKTVIELLKTHGGKEEATVIRYGCKMPCTNAALANGVMAFAYMADTVLSCVVHPAPVIVPTALSIGEVERASGNVFITSVVVGYEVMVRVASALNSGRLRMALHAKGFHPTGVCGVFGAAATASKILRLDPDKIADAFGIAGSFASGLQEPITGPIGADSFKLHAGKAARDGIMASLLAKYGITGPHTVFEGRDGVLRAYSERGAYLSEELTKGLGETFHIMESATKIHNCCHAIACEVDALLELVERFSFRPEEVNEIIVSLPSKHYYIMCGYKDKMYSPNTYMEANMSLPFILSIALMYGEVFLDQLSDAQLRNPEALKIAKKIRVSLDKEMDPKFESTGSWPAKIKVKLRDGREYSQTLEHPKGSPRNPLTKEELETKFRRLATTSMSQEKINGAIRKLSRLERIDNVSEIIRYFIE